MTLGKAIQIIQTEGKGVSVSSYNEAVEFLNKYCRGKYFHKIKG